MKDLMKALEPYAERFTLRHFNRRPDILWFTPRQDLTVEEHATTLRILEGSGLSLEMDEFSKEKTLRLGRVQPSKRAPVPIFII